MTEENTPRNGDSEVDEWGEDSFPASDPPSNTPRPEDEDDTAADDSDEAST